MRISRMHFVVWLLIGSSSLCLPHNMTAQASPVHAPQQIREEMFVTIGGIDQWLTIKGEDRNNPVVLFLHGGPGDALSPFADALYAGWEKDFTLVQWDQRGAGRTYSKNGPSIEPTMTVERMTQDGVEVAEFLTKHLHKRKIIIVGGSWGSILGISISHAKPELFYAYVGVAQMVNWQENVSASDNDMNRVFQAYPSLSYLRSPTIGRDITLTPGQFAEGLVIFNYPITKDQWDKLQTAKVVVSFKYQKNLELNITR